MGKTSTDANKFLSFFGHRLSELLEPMTIIVHKQDRTDRNIIHGKQRFKSKKRILQASSKESVAYFRDDSFSRVANYY